MLSNKLFYCNFFCTVLSYLYYTLSRNNSESILITAYQFFLRELMFTGKFTRFQILLECLAFLLYGFKLFVA